MKEKSMSQIYKTNTKIAIVALIIFIGLFIYSWGFGYNSGKLSSAMLVVGGIVMVIQRFVLYKMALKKEKDINKN